MKYNNKKDVFEIKIISFFIGIIYFLCLGMIIGAFLYSLEKEETMTIIPIPQEKIGNSSPDLEEIDYEDMFLDINESDMILDTEANIYFTTYDTYRTLCSDTGYWKATFFTEEEYLRYAKDNVIKVLGLNEQNCLGLDDIK